MPAGIAGALVAARLATLGLSGYSQEYGFLEAYYSHLATNLQSDLLPRWWGESIHNTPPLYVWFLGLWSHLGTREWLLRVPSVVAWASAAYPVARVGGPWAAPIYLSLPLGFIVAGKTQPDAILSSIMAWGLWAALERHPRRFSASLVFGAMVKPHAILVAVGAVLWPFGRMVALASVAGLFFVLLKLGFLGAVLGHVEARGFGHWGLAWFLVFPVGLGSLTGLLALFQSARKELWLYLAGMVLFTLYAAPPYGPHEYYWAPALSGLAMIAGKAPRKLLIVAVAVNVGLTGYTSWMNGDLWDHRPRDLAAEWELDHAEPGLGTVASWYEGRRVESGWNGTVLAYSPRSGCTVLEEAASPYSGDHSLYVLSC